MGTIAQLKIQGRIRMPGEHTRRGFLNSISSSAVVGVAATTRSLGFSRAAAAGAEKIVLGYLPLNALLPPYVGPYDPWKEEGLEISFFRAGAGPAVLQALVTGQIPAGEIGIGPAISAASRGFPLYFVTTGATEAKPDYANTRIMTRQDSPIRSFVDLKGRKLAVHALGTMQHVCLGAAFKTFNVSRDAIGITTIPIENQPQALAQGLVDAVYCAPPADAVAEHRFGARTIVETVDFIPYLAFACIAVHREFADQHPEAVKRLIKGAIRLQRWVDDNQPLARQTSNKALDIPDDISPQVRLPYFPRNALHIMANVWHVYYMMLDGGVIDPVDDFTAIAQKYFADPLVRFTLPALAELGQEKDPVLGQIRNQQLPLLRKPAQEYQGSWESSA
jgi:ABC-type nitrate/sulfonate/bicarbonate transport system substrate-binding protein